MKITKTTIATLEKKLNSAKHVNPAGVLRALNLDPYHCAPHTITIIRHSGDFWAGCQQVNGHDFGLRLGSTMEEALATVERITSL